MGQSLSEQDNISIRKIGSVEQLSPERRHEIVDKLDHYFARIDARRRPVSEDEADAIIDEALRSTRPGYRPTR